ncbi:hypothetical protein [Streptomyces sioyaensis]
MTPGPGPGPVPPRPAAVARTTATVDPAAEVPGPRVATTGGVRTLQT